MNGYNFEFFRMLGNQTFEGVKRLCQLTGFRKEAIR